MAKDRRVEILQILKEAKAPVNAVTLAKEFDVSRQVIVGDIALLRAAGNDIVATPRGYIMPKADDSSLVRTIACVHTMENLQTEIYTIIDNGAKMLDVIVEHPIYGQITGQLNIFSRVDADEFINSVRQNRAMLLSHLTGGVHLHTIRCENEEIYQRVLAGLKSKGILLDED